ncbi:MAG: hypothetical protein JSU65_13085 [Candidatus Zixiibacteriota bacterium]|nr:MAG: hypothetical protein JSU65_13085 [candidate division Zixibacteria bacterium]
MRGHLWLPIAVVLAAGGPAASAQVQSEGIDPEAIIERILAADSARASVLEDVVFDAEYVEGKQEKSGEFVEKIRFEKKIYIKFFDDTAWYHEDFLAYYKDGEPKSDKDLQKEARERLKNKKKRSTRDISYPMLQPFYPENRERYELEYVGVAAEAIEDFVCHQFAVRSKIEDGDHINGDYYFDAESFNVVRVDFSPAKLTKKTMFRLKKLDMTIRYGPSPEGYWLPRQFDIDMKGKAAFFFGVNVRGTEYYRKPVVNDGIDDEVFEVDNDE